MKTHIRWMIGRDLKETMVIEQYSSVSPWSESNFLHVLKSHSCIGMVAEWQDTIVGFMIYELQKRSIELFNIAVHPGFRRLGVGRQLAEKIKSKLSTHRRRECKLRVRETNLSALLFWRAMGWRAVGLARQHYDDTGEDAVRMVYLAPADSSLKVI